MQTRSGSTRSTAAFVVLATLAMSGGDVLRTRAAAPAGDLSTAWRSLTRKIRSRKGVETLHARAAVEITADGGLAGSRVTVSLYSSEGGALSDTAVPFATKRVRLRSGPRTTVRLSGDLPFGARGRFVVARVDDADEIEEPDEQNNTAARGPLSTGEEYAPLAAGDRRTYLVRRKTFGTGGTTEGVERRVVVGDPTEIVPGQVAFPIAWNEPFDARRNVVQTIVRADDGVHVVDFDDPTDDRARQLTPYRALAFPFTSKYSFRSIAGAKLTTGEDDDGDGVAESIRVRQTVAFKRLEDVETPAGSFALCAHIVRKTSSTLRHSRTGRRFRLRVKEDQWLAPGIGPVKSRTVSTWRGEPDRSDEELISFATRDSGSGITHDLRPTATAAPAGTGPEERASAAYGDEHALLAFWRYDNDEGPTGVVGTLLTRTGWPVREFAIDSSPIGTLDPPMPSVAFGAGIFVAVYNAAGALRARAVGPDGSFPWGPEPLELMSLRTSVPTDLVFDGTNFVVRGWQGASAIRISPQGQVLDDLGILSGTAAAFDGESTLVLRGTSSIEGTRITPAGDVLDTPALVIGDGVGTESNPTLAAGPDGGWLVVWEDTRAGGIGWDIYGCSVTSDGGVGSEFLIGNMAPFDRRPVASHDGRDFLVVWRIIDFPGIEHPGVHARRVTSDGVVLGVSPGATDGAFIVPPTSSPHDVALTGAGVVSFGDRALVFWREWTILGGSRPVMNAALLMQRNDGTE